MVRKVIRSDDAMSDMAEIKDYISRDSPITAQRVVARIEGVAERLADFPYAARMIAEFQDRRETFVYQYRLMYRVEPDRVRILRVVHGRRLLSNVPGSFEEPPQDAYEAA
jgi:plasmid stabilization system protein ParE